MIRLILVFDIFFKPCWPGSYLHSSKSASDSIFIWALAFASVPPRCLATRVTSFSPDIRSWRIFSRVPDDKARPIRSIASLLSTCNVSDSYPTSLDLISNCSSESLLYLLFYVVLDYCTILSQHCYYE